MRNVKAGERGMFSTFIGLCRNNDGATAIEYGLIAALVSVVAIAALMPVGTNLSSTLHTLAIKLYVSGRHSPPSWPEIPPFRPDTIANSSAASRERVAEAASRGRVRVFAAP